MSKEYIEKEAAIDYLTLNMNWYDEDGGQVDDWDERKAIISDLLDGIPPAEVKPVVMGEWIENPIGEYVCNHCSRVVKYYENFCPDCGADMRKGETMDDDEYDICYECGGYGDDYSIDESGELVWNCPTCPCNPHRKEKEDEP